MDPWNKILPTPPNPPPPNPKPPQPPQTSKAFPSPPSSAGLRPLAAYGFSDRPVAGPLVRPRVKVRDGKGGRGVAGEGWGGRIFKFMTFLAPKGVATLVSMPL